MTKNTRRAGEQLAQVGDDSFGGSLRRALARPDRLQGGLVELGEPVAPRERIDLVDHKRQQPIVGPAALAHKRVERRIGVGHGHDLVERELGALGDERPRNVAVDPEPRFDPHRHAGNPTQRGEVAPQLDGRAAGRHREVRNLVDRKRAFHKHAPRRNVLVGADRPREVPARKRATSLVSTPRHGQSPSAAVRRHVWTFATLAGNR